MTRIATNQLHLCNSGEFEVVKLQDPATWHYHLIGFREGTSVKFQIGDNGSTTKLLYDVSASIKKVLNENEQAAES